MNLIRDKRTGATLLMGRVVEPGTSGRLARSQPDARALEVLKESHPSTRAA
jgi:hypothetical protein